MRSSPGLELAKPVTVAAGEPAAANVYKGQISASVQQASASWPDEGVGGM